MKRLSEVLTSSLDKKLSEAAAVNKAWQHACGDSISFMTTVVKFTDGILTVAVHDQTWLSELNFMKGELTERMKQYGLGVSSIHFYFKIRYAKPDSIKYNKKTMSDKEKQYADRILNTIKDEKLRESFRHAMYSYFTVFSIDDYLG